MIEPLIKRRRAIFYLLIALVITLSSVSVIWMPQKYLLSWDEVPGNDSDRLIEFLEQNYIKGINKSNIEKSEDGLILRLYSQNKSISLSLNNEKTRAVLRLDERKTEEFIVKAENGKLNIYLQYAQTTLKSGSPPLIVFIPLFAYIIMILLPVVYKRYDKERFMWGHRFFKGALLGFALMTMIFLTELASGFLHIEDIAPDVQNVLIAGLLLQIIVAFGEELPFRGYILPDLEKRYGAWKAVFLSSLFFSLLHIPSISTLNMSEASIIIMLLTITLAEILLAVCYLYDGLRMSIGFHFSWNFFQYHFYSMREGFGGILTITSEHELLTGGALGPEAGLLGLVVVILALIIVFLWMRSR